MRTTLRWHTGSVCLGLVLASTLACGSSASPRVASVDSDEDAGALPGTSSTSSTGGEDAGSYGGEDAGAAPQEDAGDGAPASTIDPNGVYVAPTGSDTAAGTATAPLATAAAGIAMATKAGRPLYLCAATFSESISITGALSIDGSHDCTNGWAATTSFATLAPASGVPITVNAGSSPVSLTNVSALAPDNYDPGGSSVAMFVTNSKNVTIQHAQLTAGIAGDGASAKEPSPSGSPAPNGANGQSLADFGCGPGETTGQCAAVAQGGDATPGGCYGIGGRGGNGGNIQVNVGAQSGEQGLPSNVGGAGDTNTSYVGRGAGLPGMPGSIGQPGSPASSGIGSLTASGYVASNTGGSGTQGSPGGGGGGGGGGYSGSQGQLCDTNFLGGGGGQGGFGGCGGSGTQGSGAGGASVALLVFSSGVQVTDVIISAGSGGNGGQAAAGGTGEAGGQGGQGGAGSHADQGYPSCTSTSSDGNADSGGPGGAGGKGGAGGPGGGGPSAGILANVTPTLTAVTYNVGTGGTGGHAISGPDAADGETGTLIVLGAGSP